MCGLAQCKMNVRKITIMTSTGESSSTKIHHKMNSFLVVGHVHVKSCSELSMNYVRNKDALSTAELRCALHEYEETMSSLSSHNHSNATGGQKLTSDGWT